MPALLTRMSSPPKRSTRGRDHRPHVGARRDVGAHADAPSRRARRRRARAPSPSRSAIDDARALGDELPRDAGAEARAAAGDDRDLACESHGRCSSSCSAVLDRDRLQRREAVERLEALLAAVARVLDAAERQLDAAAGAVVVDEHLAAAQRRAPGASGGRRRGSRRRRPGRTAVPLAMRDRLGLAVERRSPPAPGRRSPPAPARGRRGTSASSVGRT